MKFLLLSFGIIILILFSCEKKSVVTKTVTDTLTYELNSESRLPFQNLSFCAITSQQSILVQGDLVNNTNDVIQILTNEISLETKEGNRNNPVLYKQDTVVIVPEQSFPLKLLFVPVHSRFLFQQNNLRGNIDSNYKLLIPFHHKQGERIDVLSFSIDSVQHKQAVARFGMNVTPFKIALDQSFVNKTTNSTDQLQINENEILKKGFWVKLNAYQQNDSVVIRYRMVNQSGGEVLLNKKQFTLLTDGEEVLPETDSVSEVILNNADRYQFISKYPIRKSSFYILEPDGIYISEAGKKISLFTERFLLQPLEIPQ